ncbi:MAG: DUF5703 domain-containing protein [Microscillaceae bacterium]|nr:DUF5703 domain-containing protein [Microscillaceae bacterium]
MLDPQQIYRQVSDYKVVWDSPSLNEHGSMPLGNGDIGLNVWIEESGDLLFYLAKTDAWDEYGRLLKLGKIRVKTSPQTFKKGDFFRQILHLDKGEIEVLLGKKTNPLKLKIWADATQPIVHLEAQNPDKIQLTAQLETWRTQTRTLSNQLSTWQKAQLFWGYLKLITAMRLAPQNASLILFELLEIGVTEKHSAFDLQNAPEAVKVNPDKIVVNADNQVIWLHQNQSSVFPKILTLQGLNPTEYADPLRNRIFGGIIFGENWQKKNSQTLESQINTKHHLQIFLLTLAQTNEKKWLDSLQKNTQNFKKMALDSLRQAHQKWWTDYWNQSHIFVNGNANAHLITQGAVLQRFISACAGRGGGAIKFNGSLFTVGAEFGGKKYDADFRRWGGPYWWQNTRLIYYPMLAQGDWKMMLPMFEMYKNVLPLAQKRTKLYFNHEGIFLPETMNFWGTYGADDYGWNRENKKLGEVQNTYHRYYYSNSLEISSLALDYFVYSQDSIFLKDIALPLSEGIIDFYDQHFKRRAGKLFISPAQSLETWAVADNPSPDIAGMRLILSKLISQKKYLNENKTQKFERILNELPPLPTKTKNGSVVVLPAEKFEKRQNLENAETYVIFPYRQFGIGKPNLEIGIQTFENRTFKGNQGWQYDDVQAAYLGLTEEAKSRLINRATQKNPCSRFPAFWGPNFDWLPDQCHGGNLQMTLQSMLLQTDGDKILLFPAWDKAWDVDFKLFAPKNTVIEVSLKKGKLEKLKINPESRKKDLKIILQTI